MPMRRFERITLAPLLLAGCAIVFGVCLLIEAAGAQYVPPPTPLPPPVFNPSSPYTVPQRSYTPIAPSNAVPGYVVTSPVNGPAARSAVRSHRRTTTAPAVPHRHRAIVVRRTPASYSYSYPPFGYDYGCAWRRAWDGYWFRTAPCS